jgi:hypothetical protein
MRGRYSLWIVASVLAPAIVACGSSTGTTSPKPIDGHLLRASDIPSMRLQGELPADAEAFANILAGGEVFKDDPPVATTKLKGFGFKRGYAESWGGAGLQGGAFVAEFDSADHAEAALQYMNTELFRECPNEPNCSNRLVVKHPAIPNFVGQALTPLRPPSEGRRFTVYKFVFRIGAIVYGVKDGGDDGYDPGSVSQAQALALVDRVYARVKGLTADATFKGTPDKPLGPPPRGPIGVSPGGPPSGAPSG